MTWVDVVQWVLIFAVFSTLPLYARLRRKRRVPFAFDSGKTVAPELFSEEEVGEISPDLTWTVYSRRGDAKSYIQLSRHDEALRDESSAWPSMELIEEKSSTYSDGLSSAYSLESSGKRRQGFKRRPSSLSKKRRAVAL